MKKAALAAHLGLGAALAATSGCGLPYVVRSASFQLELLGSGEPVDAVLASGTLSVGQQQRLRLFGQVKAWGAAHGFSATHNYDRYAVRWHRRIWNLSACPPYSLDARTWWFPIVGTVPYLGFFDEGDVARTRAGLEAEGLEVYVREVGAYSTLGWFRDPVLPTMLRWDEARIAETVLHELAHATLWVPGSVSFNESFARLVGEAAGDRYLVDTYGEGSPEVQRARDRRADGRRFTAVLVALHADLAALYAEPGLDEPTRAERKAALYASLEGRIRAAGFADADGWATWARREAWNNPRLSQFRTYNTGEAELAAIFAGQGGDVGRFIGEIRRLTRGRRDPWAAVREAAAGLPPAP